MCKCLSFSVERGKAGRGAACRQSTHRPTRWVQCHFPQVKSWVLYARSLMVIWRPWVCLSYLTTLPCRPYRQRIWNLSLCPCSHVVFLRSTPSLDHGGEAGNCSSLLSETSASLLSISERPFSDSEVNVMDPCVQELCRVGASCRLPEQLRRGQMCRGTLCTRFFCNCRV